MAPGRRSTVNGGQRWSRVLREELRILREVLVIVSHKFCFVNLGKSAVNGNWSMGNAQRSRWFTVHEAPRTPLYAPPRVPPVLFGHLPIPVFIQVFQQFYGVGSGSLSQGGRGHYMPMKMPKQVVC